VCCVSRRTDVFLEGEMPYYFDIALKNTHMRFENLPNGKLLAYWGGYQDWKEVCLHVHGPVLPMEQIRSACIMR